MVVMAEVNWELVFPLITAARDEEAVSVWAFTSVVTLAIPVPSEVEAVKTVALVLELTVAVPAEMREPTDEEAMSVWALTADVIPEV